MNKITRIVRFGSLYGGICTGATNDGERQFISKHIKSPLQGSAADIYNGLQGLLKLGARIPAEALLSAQRSYDRLQSSIAAMNYGRDVTGRAAAWSSQSRKLIALRQQLQSTRQSPEVLMGQYADICRAQVSLAGQELETVSTPQTCDEMAAQVQQLLTQSLMNRRALHQVLAH